MSETETKSIDMDTVENNVREIEATAKSEAEFANISTDDERVEDVDMEFYKFDSRFSYSVYVPKDVLDMEDIVAGDNVDSDESPTTLDEALGIQGVFSEFVHTLSEVHGWSKKKTAMNLKSNFECIKSFPNEDSDEYDFVQFAFFASSEGVA